MADQRRNAVEKLENMKSKEQRTKNFEGPDFLLSAATVAVKDTTRSPVTGNQNMILMLGHLLGQLQGHLVAILLSHILHSVLGHLVAILLGHLLHSLLGIFLLQHNPVMGLFPLLGLFLLLGNQLGPPLLGMKAQDWLLKRGVN